MNFDALFQPVQIGTMTVKNRFIMAPMATNLGNDDATPSPRMIAYYRERALGGFGLITVEATSVHPTAKGMVRQAGLYDDASIPAWKRLTDAVHEGGAKVTVEIYHGGRQTHESVIGETTWSASQVSCPRSGEMPRALTTEEVWGVIDLFGDAALRAKKAGFDSVCVHSSAGYFLAEFLSSHANKRVDEFGGSLEGRTKILVEILKNIRKKCGEGFPVTIRIVSDEHVIDGIVPHEAAAIAMIMEDAGYDAIDLSQCCYETLEWTTPTAAMTRPGWSGYASAEIKKAVSVPVSSSGRYNDPYVMLQALKLKKLDMISLGREAIADPYIVNKIKEGRIDEISPCIACNQSCIGYLLNNKEVCCLVNPLAGREDCKMEPARSKKTVAVVGAGPAGLYCAMLAAKRGHQVEVYDKGRQPGGQFRIASVPEGKQDLARAIKYYVTMGKKYGVTYHMETEMKEEDLASLQTDVLVLATGSVPMRLPIKGMDNPKLADAADVLDGKINYGVGKRILVIGGGMTGTETAMFLAERQHEVALIELREKIAMDVTDVSRKELLSILEKRKVRILTKSKVKEFFEDGILYQDESGKEASLRGFDGIVLAMGVKSYHPFESFQENGKEVYVIGDAKQVGQANQAIESGRDAALAI